MSHWLNDTDSWLEIFKRKLGVTHRDLYVYLDHCIEKSTLEFIDVQACALTACRAVGYPVFTAAIEKNMEQSQEKAAAAIAASMCFLNSTWINYLESINENHQFLTEPHHVLTPNGGVSEIKFNMYCLSACVVYGSRHEILRHIEFLKNHISQDQINDIVRIAAVIAAAIKAQV